MSSYNNTIASTTKMPSTTTQWSTTRTQPAWNQTLNLTTSGLLSSSVSTTSFNNTRYNTMPTSSFSRSITYAPDNEGNSESDRTTLVIGTSIAAFLLIVILFTVALVVIKKRRKQTGSKNENKNEKKDKKIAVESHGNIMTDVKMAITKKNGADQEYDDVVSTVGEDYPDNDYEYVHVTPTSAQQPYNSLGPQDAQNIYEQINQNASEDSASYSGGSRGAEYQNCIDGQGAQGNEDAELTNQAEMTKDGYLVPVPPTNTGNGDSLYSATYVKVVP